MHLEKSGANVRVTKFYSLKSSEKSTKKIYETGDAIEVEEGVARGREREKQREKENSAQRTLNMQISKWITHEYLKT